MTKIEDFRVANPRERIRGIDLTTVDPGTSTLLEVVLHAGEAAPAILRGFVNYLAHLHIDVDIDGRIDIDGLSFVPVRATLGQIEAIAAFAFTRVIREMPRLRQPTCGDLTAQHGTFAWKPPRGGPIDASVRAVVIDGGLPSEPNLAPWVTLHEPEGVGAPVPEYQHHGLAVTSALLFGSLERDQPAATPFVAVDHYRVLDENTAKEPQAELYHVLRRVFSILRNGRYEYAVLCIGPFVPVDDEVHPWTILMDKAVASGTTFLSVAGGNTGESDANLGLNRIQPPGDSVNAFTVGASATKDTFWCRRAPYSSVGPGRSPGSRKPDGLAFGGTEHEPFWVLGPGGELRAIPTMGSSFSAPEALRAGLGARAHIGPVLTPLGVRALLTHRSELGNLSPVEAGWGLICTDIEELVTCFNGTTHILYQDRLEPKKYLRAEIPIPAAPLEGLVTLTATICFATDVDPQDPIHYTRSGVEVVFRPDKLNIPVDAEGKKGTPPSDHFFGYQEGMTEIELREDAHKWETTLHATRRIHGRRLKNPVFDIHFNPRRGGRDVRNAKAIPYAMVVSLQVPSMPDLYDKLWHKYRFVLERLEPKIKLPVRT